MTIGSSVDGAIRVFGGLLGGVTLSIVRAIFFGLIGFAIGVVVPSLALVAVSSSVATR